jgi:hypothetical protein
VRPGDARVRVTQNARGRMQNVRRGVAPALVAGLDEPPMPTQITTLTGPGEVVGSIVLVQHPGPNEPQIGPGHGLTLRADHDVLWLDADPTSHVQDAQEALLDRL